MKFWIRPRKWVRRIKKYLRLCVCVCVCVCVFVCTCVCEMCRTQLRHCIHMAPCDTGCALQISSRHRRWVMLDGAGRVFMTEKGYQGRNHIWRSMTGSSEVSQKIRYSVISELNDGSWFPVPALHSYSRSSDFHPPSEIFRPLTGTPAGAG